MINHPPYNAHRLAFAQARGARIQIKRPQVADRYYRNWHPNHGQDPLQTQHWSAVQILWRIHPKDAHLEYGPLSTALINLVLYDEFPEETDQPMIEMLVWYRGIFDESLWDDNDDAIEADHRKFYLLLMAEWYADQGM
jgi:hypothetical protein